MMSAVWELADGTRTFERLCLDLDSIFKEEISPVEARTAAAIEALARIGCMEVLTQPFDGNWNTSPGVNPEGDPIEAPSWLRTTAIDQEE